MSETSFPPCGSERDRLVAQAVGWEWDEAWSIVWDNSAPGPAAFPLDRYPSSSDPDALAALEAWVDAAERGEDRGYQLHRQGTGRRLVHIWRSNHPAVYGAGDTIRDAATAALARWYLDTQEAKP